MSVDVALEGGVLTATLNRPEARNALNPETGAGLFRAVQQAANDDAVRVLIVTGAGTKVFSAGMDLKAFASGADMAPVGQALTALRECPKPVIAAVNGSALAGGFELMMQCDLVVAARHALFGIPEVKRGLVSAGGGTRLPARIPIALALELGLTGEPIDADTALRWGLVNRVVDGDDVIAIATSLASTIAANGPLAVRATKQLMREELGPGYPDSVRAIAGPVFASEDAVEGATAFAQRRAPRWTSR